jgi:hypothetical protein
VAINTPFVYRYATITKKASAHTAQQYLHLQKTLRANFSVKNGTFDFALLTIHTSPSKAKTELPALQPAMSETRTYYNEQDVICLGDFNADGTYYSDGAAGASLNGWSTTTYITVIKNGVDTTVSTGNSYTYDRMQIYKGASYQDYTGYSSRLKFSVTTMSACWRGQPQRRARRPHSPTTTRSSPTSARAPIPTDR